MAHLENDDNFCPNSAFSILRPNIYIISFFRISSKLRLLIDAVIFAVLKNNIPYNTDSDEKQLTDYL